MSSEDNIETQEHFVYCPECGKLTDEKKSGGIDTIQICFYCNRKHRPRY